MAITKKNIRFIKEYRLSLNGADAARKAGYSEKTARTIASEILAKPDIKAKIAEYEAIEREQYAVKQEDIVKVLWSIAKDLEAKHSDRTNAALGTAKVLGITKDTTPNINIFSSIEKKLKHRLSEVVDTQEVEQAL